jgi:hypothetical protein
VEEFTKERGGEEEEKKRDREREEEERNNPCLEPNRLRDPAGRCEGTSAAILCLPQNPELIDARLGLSPNLGTLLITRGQSG